MATRTSSGEITLQVRRTVAAARERVFRAWTDAEEFRKWWGPPGYSTPSADIDLRAGGRYRIAMKSPGGEVLHLTGVFREVRPPDKLVYTWNWEGTRGEHMGETLVTVEFLDRGRSTEIVVTHEGFPNDERRDGHQQGWLGCLDRLADAL